MNIVQTGDQPFSISYTTAPEDKNVNGLVHGGVIFYLADEAIGRYVTRMGRVGASADGNIHYYHPVRLGETITAAVRPRKIGRRLATFLVEVSMGDRLVADAVFTVCFQDQPPEKE